LSDEDKLVAKLVGVEEAFIFKLMIGTVSSKDDKHVRRLKEIYSLVD
jgi:hypothetical protein